MVESRLIGYAVVVYAAATVAYFLAALSRRKAVELVSSALAGVGLFLNTAALVGRIVSAGRPPLTNTYETLLVFAWLLVLSYLIGEIRYRTRAVGLVVLPLALLALAATSLVSGEVQPLVPSLRSNWLLVHVVTCFCAYAAFGLSFATSLLLLIARLRRSAAPAGSDRRKLLPDVSTLDDLTHKSIAFGFPLLTIGIATGAVWANSCWGRYWGWDPKETWSLVTWLVYAVCLHMRHTRDWHGKLGAATASFGFLCAVFTYLGVNYLLSGLHSYS